MEGELLLVAIVAGRHVALPAKEVASVSELEKVTPAPRAPHWIEGVGAQRSRALTVVNCQRAIGLKSTDHQQDGEEETRCIVALCDDYLYALRVDAILDVTMAKSDLAPAPRGLGATWSSVATGVIETAFGPALMLDLPALLAGPSREAA